MLKATKIVLIMFLALSMSFTSCIQDFFGDDIPNDDGSDTEITLNPVKSDAEGLPTDRDYQYYIINAGDNQDIFKGNAHQDLLKKLIAKDYDMKYAWYPMTPSMCKAMGAIEAFVVILEKQDDSIMEMGFKHDVGYWILNCGVNEYMYYQFDKID